MAPKDLEDDDIDASMSKSFMIIEDAMAIREESDDPVEEESLVASDWNGTDLGDRQL